MAEIKIEKKKPIWPWIVALLIISALVYFVFFRNYDATPESSIEIENATSTDSITN